MYLHLGRDVAVPESSIIGIFDLDTSSAGRRTKDFLRRAEKSGRVVNVSDDLPKSFILCGDKTDCAVYISQISSATLLKRVDQGPLPNNFIR